MSDELHLQVSDTQKRRERIVTASQRPAEYSPGYSRFIRLMRLILPMFALAIIAVVFTWSNMRDDGIVPVQEEASAPKTIGKNELVNPRFESVDEKKQPYTITAKRAIQGETNDDLVILEEPLADMLLNSGNWIAIEAQQGAFRQDNQRLLLKGQVRLFHDRGYQLETPKLHVDLDNNTAWSEEDVHGQGPAGTIEAKGLRADSDHGHLTFTGPAKLVLNRNASNLDMGSMFDE